MATNFPTTLDSLTNPNAGDAPSAPSHSAQHANANDAVEALEAKVGVDSSAVATSLDYRLGNTTGGHRHGGAGTDGRKVQYTDLASIPSTFTPAAHKANHVSGGSDPFAAGDLLDATAKIAHRKNTGANVGSRRRLNWIEGTNISITVSDDAGSEEMDVTIAQSGTASHGASSHTDLRREIWIPAEQMTADASTATTVGTSPDMVRTLRCADAATQGGFFSLLVPNDYVSGGDIIIYWMPQASVGGSTAAIWDVTHYEAVAGADVGTAGATATVATTSSVKTIRQLQIEATTTLSGSPTLTAGRLLRLDVRRTGGAGADNFTSGADMIGVVFGYTANQ